MGTIGIFHDLSSFIECCQIVNNIFFVCELGFLFVLWDLLWLGLLEELQKSLSMLKVIRKILCLLKLFNYAEGRKKRDEEMS